MQLPQPRFRLRDVDGNTVEASPDGMNILAIFLVSLVGFLYVFLFVLEGFTSIGWTLVASIFLSAGTTAVLGKWYFAKKKKKAKAAADLRNKVLAKSAEREFEERRKRAAKNGKTYK